MKNSKLKTTSQQVPQSLLVMGKFGTVHGVKGLVKVISSTEQAANIFNYVPWYIKLTPKSPLQNFIETSDSYLVIKVTQWQHMKGDLFAKIDGFDDRETAILLNNHEIAIDRNSLPSLAEDYYWVDLIGSKIVTPEGLVLGKVSTIMETGSNDVLVVKASFDAIDKKERLIPFIMDQVIINFNKEEKILTVNWDVDF